MRTSSPATPARHSKANLPAKKRLVARKVTFEKSPSKSKPKNQTSAKYPRQGRPKAESFIIVGIGASAGGLEAFTQLLRCLPSNTGMGFVFVQHLDPKHGSILTELLSHRTKMPVHEVKDGIPVEPNQVYIMPPNTVMNIKRGLLNLMPRTEIPGHHLPIDLFFNSLAEDKNPAIGVILSGAASDGALGLEAIKASGGITFAQDETSAKYGGMPHSAVVAGAADFVLPPEGIARELVRISRHPHLSRVALAPPKGDGTNGLLPKDDLDQILGILKSFIGFDFTYYKHPTLERRILRRMAVRKMENIKDYVKYLRDNSTEAKALYHDILINVTGFFRDPKTFKALEERVFSEITRNREKQTPIRIWVPGCSTGEEAYSVAISLVEFLEKNATNIPIQIFATDIRDAAIDRARAGRYPESIARSISPERLQRFFVKVEDGYQVGKPIRDICVFAKHDLTKDPPFSGLDLISCRNVLIYMGPVLQKGVMGVFHYALKETGFLLLGKAEAIGKFSDLFAPVDKKYKVYSKKQISTRLEFELRTLGRGLKKTDISKDAGEPGLDIKREADRILLSKYAPASVIVNGRLEILNFRGNTGLYLEHSSGEASLNLLKMARKGIETALRPAIHKAKEQDAPVRNEGLQIKYNGQFRKVNVEVIPLRTPRPGEGCFLILFEDATSRRSGDPESRALAPFNGRVQRRQIKEEKETTEVTLLKQELANIKKDFQSISKEYEVSNEELKAANEEVLSSNEELQSVNEELETAQEELQSTNEELTTLNEELQNRNLALALLNNDVINLITSVHLPVIMFGSDLCIRRFTPMAEKILNLNATDIGRPLGHLKLGVKVPDLEFLILETINTGAPKEREVQDRADVWYSMQIQPYRTMENKIDGAVLTLIDIDERKRNLEYIKECRDYAEGIVETVREPLLILDQNLRIKSANLSFYQTFQTSPKETENRLIFELGNRHWDIPSLRKVLKQILSENTSFQSFEVTHEFPSIGRKTMLLNARRIAQRGNEPEMILLAMEDDTERKQMEEELRKSRNDLELRVRERTVEVYRQAELLDLAHDAIIVREMDGVITFWNNGAEEMYGWKRKEALGKIMRDLLQTEFPQPRDEIMAKLTQEGRWEGELTYTRKDGKKINVLGRWVIQRDEEGRPAGVMLINRDITKRLILEEQLRQAQKMEAMGTLAGGIAHDFNNMLSTIDINADLALLDLPAESGARLNLEMINKAAQRGRGLVKQILLFSRKGEKRQDLFTLSPLIKETFKLLRSSLPTTIDMELRLGTDSDIILGDPSQIQQVIMNLCTNAAYAMRGTMGLLEISLKTITFSSDDPLPDAEMSPGDYLVLSVKDAGHGMDEEVIKHIFDPFFTTKPIGEGTGLGLSVVYGIVKSHKGGITVCSEPDKGSVFEVFLPKADTGVPVEAETSGPIPGGNERILFVDDEEMILNSVRNMLQRLGYRVTALADAQEALRIFSENPSEFDLVITDHTMPRMTGEALGKEMMRIRSDIPIILCTGYNDLISSEKAIAMGFRGFIMKPINLREGSQFIRRVLDQTQSQSII